MTREQIDSIIAQSSTQSAGGQNPNPTPTSNPTIQPVSAGNFGPDRGQSSVEQYMHRTEEPSTFQLMRIVNDMSEDRNWLERAYGEDHPGERNPYSTPQVGMFPRTQPKEYFSSYPGEENVDFLYNNPQYKALADYFADRGLEQWLYDSPWSSDAAHQEALAGVMNLAQGINDYTQRKNQEQYDREDRDYNLYGRVLSDLLDQTPQGQNLINEALGQMYQNRHDQRMQEMFGNPRQRNISQMNTTGNGQGAFRW